MISGGEIRLAVLAVALRLHQQYARLRQAWSEYGYRGLPE